MIINVKDVQAKKKNKCLISHIYCNIVNKHVNHLLFQSLQQKQKQHARLYEMLAGKIKGSLFDIPQKSIM